MAHPPRSHAGAWVAVALGVVTMLQAVASRRSGGDLSAPTRAAPASAPAPSAPVRRETLRVPRAAGPIVLDGKTADPGWLGPVALTPPLASVDGKPMADSVVRAAWGDGKLYLTLFAADTDIRASAVAHDAPLWPEDSFRLAFDGASAGESRVLSLSPLGTVNDAIVRGDRIDTAWESGAMVAHDIDGTANDARDEDEEWVLEVAIPLASLGLRGVPGERIGFSARRCDVREGARRRCAAWGEPAGELVLE